MNDRIINVFSAQAGSYAILIHRERGGLILPVIGWVAREKTNRLGDVYLELTPLVSDSTSDEVGEPHEITQYYQEWEWKTFAPGEAAYRWIEIFEQEYYKVASWDVSNWWPSKSPLFATADEMLWSEGFLPPDIADGGE